MMNKLLLILMASFILTGCAGFNPLEIFTRQAPVEIIHPALPEQGRFDKITWYNLNKDILKRMVKDSSLNDDEYVFIALTPRGYEAISKNVQELKRIIKQQKEIIIYYRKITSELEELRGTEEKK